MKPKTVLFTGYAPVHFVCFAPLFERLSRDPGYEVLLSGGLRTRLDEATYEYDLPGLYSPFGIPEDSMIPVPDLAQMDVDVLFGANTKLIAPRYAGRKVQIFHGVSFRNRAVRAENTECDHYFVVGPYMHRRFVDGSLIQADDPRMLKIGFMKTDRLLDGSLSRKRILEQYGFSGDRPVLLYAPTGQKHNSLELMGPEVIKVLADTGLYDIIIKLHDHPKNKGIDWPSRLKDQLGPHTRIATDYDVIPMMFAADLLITDASSVSSEYSLLNRPMVFLHVEKLIKTARAKEGSQVDLETWGRRAGQIVRSPSELPGVVQESLAYPEVHSTIRRAMADDLFYNPGTATDAAFEWLQGQGRTPAAALSAEPACV